MNRLTRQVGSLNSPNSHRFILPLHRRDPTAGNLAGVSSPYTRSTHPRQPLIHFSTPANRKFTSFASPASRRKPNPLPMDSDAPRLPESDAPAVAADDFVHIDNSISAPDSDLERNPKPDPRPNLDGFSYGIFGGDQLRSDYGAASGGSGGSGGGEMEDEGKRVLPEELMRSVMVLSCESTEGGSCDVYVVGTAHVSQESCREVQAIISFLKPQVVFLELCASRVAVLTPQNLKVPSVGEMVDMWKKKHNVFGILYSWFLAKVASKLEVFPGSEFRVAFEEAMKYGSKVILGDRPVGITLRRTWGKMPLWHKAKLVYSMLFQAVFLPSPEDLDKMLKEMDNVDVLTLVIQEMSKEFPTLMETLVHERDQYMSSTLLKVASEHSSVVAVVGKGHLQGIKKHWNQPVEMKNLLEIPSQKPAVSAVKIFTSLGVAVAGVAIISGIFLAAKK